MQSRSDNLERIFNLAFDAASADRPAILDRECGDDADLRSQLMRMLAVAEDDQFLAAPSLEAAIQSFGPPVEGPGTRIGPYKLLQQIGEGGFGVVFMAEQERPVTRKVALKIIKLGMDTKQVVARFEQERQALALMDHPNIARVFDAGATDTGRPYFVMELCAGESITAFCDAQRLAVRQRLDLMVQVCDAVQHAHLKGLIHRDIKPSNILVSNQDGKPQAKIIDFGISKATQSKLTERTLFTEHRQLIGTPQYMSPEQAEGSPDIDTRTDVYSLGVLLYELLTGCTPFDADALRGAAYAEMQRIIREVDPPKPSTRLAQSKETIAGVAASRDLEPAKLGSIVRGELDWIVMKALEKDRRRRYQTANSLGSDLQRYLAGEAVIAAPQSRVYLLQKFARRNRSMVATASAVFISLLVGAVAFAWQARNARAERDRAAGERDKALLMSQFLSNTLNGVSPGVARGRDATMLKEMMDDAVRRIEKGELKNATEAEVRLRGQIGNVYRELQLFPQAQKLLDPAVRMAQEVYPGDHLFVAELLSIVGMLRRDEQNAKEAERLTSEALAMSQRLVPGDSELSADLLNNLGLLRKDAADLESAERFYRQSLDMWKRITASDHPQVAMVEANLGGLMWTRRKLDEAEIHLRASIEMNRRLFGDYPVLAGCLARLSSVQQVRGNLDAAEQLANESLEMRRRLYGNDNNRDVADSLVQSAAVQLARRNYAAAEPMLVQALAAFRNAYRSDSRVLVNTMNNLSTAQFFVGKLDEAEKTALEALAMQRRLAPQETQPVASSLINLTNNRRAKGDLAAAEGYAREAVEVIRRSAKGDDPVLAETIYTLALVAVDKADYGQARKLLEEASGIFRRLYKDGHPLLANSLAELSFLHAQQGDLAAAEPLARDALAMILRTSGPDHRHTGNARLRLGQVMLAQKRLEDAETELRAAHSVLSKAPGVMVSRLQECITSVASLYAERNKTDPTRGFDALEVEWRAKLTQPTTRPTP